jgi:hypothetical protein
MQQRGFFEIEDGYARMDAAGDPRSNLDAVVDWRGLETLIRDIINGAIPFANVRASKSSREHVWARGSRFPRVPIIRCPSMLRMDS